MVLNLIIHWLHLLSSITWIGGLIFNLLVLSPNLHVIEMKPRVILLNRVFKRFLHFVWGSIILLVITGSYRVLAVNRMTTLDALMVNFYGQALIGKIILVGVMITLALYITILRYPKASTHLNEHELENNFPKKCAICQNNLRRLKQLMTIVLSLGVIVVLIAATLRAA